MNTETANVNKALRNDAHVGVNAYNWSATHVGAPSAWPTEWRAALDLCLNAWVPVFVAVGHELELVYNDEFARLAGWSGLQRMGSPLREAWSQAWHDQLEPLIAHALASERALSIDLALPSGLGRARLSLSTLHDELGRPTGILAVAVPPKDGALGDQHCQMLHELLKQAMTMRRLEEAEDTCRELIAAVHPSSEVAALYILDSVDGTLRRSGRRGSTTSDLPQTITDAAPIRVADDRLAELLARSWNSAPGATGEMLWFPIERPEGLLGVLIVGTSGPLAESPGPDFIRALVRHLGVVIAHVQSRSDGEQRHLYAEGMVVPVRDFITNLGQQLRAPLALLIQEIDELLSSRAVSAGARTQLRIARRRARRLGGLIDILSDLSRFDGQVLRPHRLPTNAASATKKLCDLFRPAFEQAGIAFSATCTTLPYPALIDRAMWEKLVCNLLANALKFTLRGEVRVSQFCAADELVLVVSDTGCGIHEADIPSIFNRAASCRPGETRSHESAGIGLPLVRELVRFHGGTIQVVSKVGQGSSFTVRIPLARRTDLVTARPAEGNEFIEHGEAADTLEAMWEWSVPSAGASSDDDEVGRVLVAESNPEQRKSLWALLGARWKVEIVPDGLTALASAFRAPPALVLTDVDIDGIDGLTLARTLHDDPRTADVPVVLLCGRNEEQASIDGLSAGALDYIVKPISTRELLARLEARLSEAHERQRARAGWRAAERDSQLKDDVIAVVSHELRTPLAAILGWLQVLRDDGFSDGPAAKAIDVIERNANVQVRLLKDLFDASRMVAGKLEMEFETLSTMTALVAAAVESLRPLAQKNDVHLEVELDEDAGPVHVDPERIQQVIWNLLSNALKFTPSGGTIRTRCGVRGGQLELQVSDSGRGISREFLPHVFRRFAQERTSRAHNGLGLGLALSRYIVESHSGTIVAFSEGEGTGTTITVSLPVVRAVQ